MTSRCNLRFYKAFKALQVHDTSLIRCHSFYNRLIKSQPVQSTYTVRAFKLVRNPGYRFKLANFECVEQVRRVLPAGEARDMVLGGNAAGLSKL